MGVGATFRLRRPARRKLLSGSRLQSTRERLRKDGVSVSSGGHPPYEGIRLIQTKTERAAPRW